MPDLFLITSDHPSLRVAVTDLYRTFAPVPDATPDRTAADHDEAAEHGELAPHMASLQRFAEKLHLAGEAGNWALAGFYEHEIEETAEAVIEGGFEEDGQEIG